MAAMSSIVSGISGLTSAISTVRNFTNTVSSLSHDPYAEQRKNIYAQQQMAMQELQQRQAMDMQGASERAALDRQSVMAEALNEDESRRASLRRAVSRQRASFGAQGIGSASGSSEAVLLGMFEESDQDRVQRERIDGLRMAAIDQSLASRHSLNMLERAQMQERHKLERQLSGGR